MRRVLAPEFSDVEPPPEDCVLRPRFYVPIKRNPQTHPKPLVQVLRAHRVQGVLATDVADLPPGEVDLHEDMRRGEREEATPDDAPRHLRRPMRAHAVEVGGARELRDDDALAVWRELDLVHPIPHLHLGC